MHKTFKVGEPVTIISNLEEHKRYTDEAGHHDSCVTGMLKYAGRTAIIRRCTDYGCYKIDLDQGDGDWNWVGNMFQEYTDEFMPVGNFGMKAWEAKSFSLTDVIGKDPCQAELVKLIEDYAEMGLRPDENWDSDGDDFDDFPTLTRNMHWLESKGFTREAEKVKNVVLERGMKLNRCGMEYHVQAKPQTVNQYFLASVRGTYTSFDDGSVYFGLPCTLNDLVRRDDRRKISVVD